jgi:hypothetical protein
MCLLLAAEVVVVQVMAVPEAVLEDLLQELLPLLFKHTLLWWGREASVVPEVPQEASPVLMETTQASMDSLRSEAEVEGQEVLLEQETA